jgi:hypothetical protein
MKKVTYEKWLTKLVENLSEHFNLSGWRISIEHLEEEPEECDSGNLEYAHIVVTPPYQMATIRVNKLAQKDFQDGNIDRLVSLLTHEVAHIFLAPLQDWMQPHLSTITAPIFHKDIEQQTQKLTMVFLKTLPKNIIPPLR